MDVYLGVAHRHHRRGLFPSPRHEDRQKGVGLYVLFRIRTFISTRDRCRHPYMVPHAEWQEVARQPLTKSKKGQKYGKEEDLYKGGTIGKNAEKDEQVRGMVFL